MSLELLVADVVKTESIEGFKLRGYQKEFLEGLGHWPHVATFDEMGVGKTVQCILMDKLRRAQAGPGKHRTLVVAPLTGVIDQWIEEFNKWAPELKVYRINSKNAKTRKGSIENFLKLDYDVFVIHPEGLRIELEALKNIKWLHFIFDEFHKIKNRATKTRKAAVELGKLVTYKTGATGTPMENRSDELWSLFHWLYPDKNSREAIEMNKWAQKLLNSYWRWYERFVEFSVDPENGYHTITGVRNTDELNRLFGPFYVRRFKSDVAGELPPKIRQEYKVDLPPKQRKAYDDMKKQLLAWVGQNEDQPVAAPVAIAQLIRLQQFALGYGELLPVSAKHKQDCPHPVRPCNCNAKPTTKFNLSEPSEKLDALMNILEDLGDQQVVVFSTSKQAIYLAKKRLDKEKIKASIITGDAKQHERTSDIKKFKARETQVMLATIRAGGVGLNLQDTCNTMIFLDRDWSPGKNQQAEDRVHRIGQKMPVHIIDIVARKTVDQKKDRTLKLKWNWIADTVGI